MKGLNKSFIYNNYPDMLDKIKAYYNEEHRYYHNWLHILSGFDMFDSVKSYNADITTEIAWLFHDIVYLPFNINSELSNEKLSAQFLVFFLKSNYPKFYLDYSDEIIEATKIIIGTEKHIPYDERTKMIYDVDLSYLSLKYNDFIEQRQLIREEYSWLTDEEFNNGTLNFYNNFLKKENIFFTLHGKENLEQRCRENLNKNKSELEQNLKDSKGE
jgi:predicted metal-dependent HD superfamily phosphohydrolase